MRLKILFLLPVDGGGGGVHSIVQEVLGMRSLGHDALVAVPEKFLHRFFAAYPSVDPRVFHGFQKHTLPQFVAGFDVLVATIFTSVRRILPICRANPHLLAAYYIQDYEPWIVDPGSEYEKEATQSYTAIPGIVCFAKTDWLCGIVEEKHGVRVHKVRPSLDTSVYFPGSAASEDNGGVSITAMIRPATPRRGARATMEVLRALQHRLEQRIQIRLFGCASDDPGFLALPRDFEFDNRGILTREGVADLLRSSDIFIDGSTYQAFGRTALEAMACGCAAIVPEKGGAGEYARDGQNSLVVDTSSTALMEDALFRLVDDQNLRRRLSREGMKTAAGYNIERAAVSEIDLFRQHLTNSRTVRSEVDKLKQALARSDKAAVAAEHEIARLERRINAINLRYRQLAQSNEARKIKQQHLQAVLTAIDTSRSWRLAQRISRLFGILTFRRQPPGDPKVGQGKKKPAPKPVAQLSSATEPSPVAIVICIHNALDDVRRCLGSIVSLTPMRHRLILVNDGSDQETSLFLRQFAGRWRHCELLESAEATGYTRAANRGLKAARGHDLVVFLNSDTAVTEGWLEGLLDCAGSSSKIGIIGPLSNAASWQSVPERFSPKGDWAVNELPPDWDAERMARLVDSVSRRCFPRVPFVNGFCFAVQRAVIDAIGEFDEQAFPKGYGEENDYCLRAAAAGFELAIADQVYVFHAKSRSYKHEVRRQLSRRSHQALEQKHGAEFIAEKLKALRADPQLEEVRQHVARAFAKTPSASQAQPAPSPGNEELKELKVLFLMPVLSGRGGGVYAVVEDAAGLRAIGSDTRIAVPLDRLDWYRQTYSAFDPELFVAFTQRGLMDLASRFQVIVATIFTSVSLLARIYRVHPEIVPAYYIQDYEPWFFDSDDPHYQEAYDSYDLIPGMLSFAKTDWLCRKLDELHGIKVHKVAPALDTSIYHSTTRATPDDGGGPIRIAAMIRPKTPRRGAKATMEVLQAVKRRLGEKVQMIIFGCESDDEQFLELARDFEFENRQILTREAVADLLRQSDIFIDFSLYQAFGRTALEAMACGCAAIVPREGGADEYAVDRYNVLVVDTRSREAMEGALTHLVEDGELRRRLTLEGLRTAGRYSLAEAARSELALFRDAMARKK